MDEHAVKTNSLWPQPGRKRNLGGRMRALNEAGAGFQPTGCPHGNKTGPRSEPWLPLRVMGADKDEGPGRSCTHNTAAPRGHGVKGKSKASPRALKLWGAGPHGRERRTHGHCWRSSELVGAQVPCSRGSVHRGTERACS